jgi:hypothetical protein
MLEKAKTFVAESFGSKVNNEAMIHFERTVYWLLQLKPEADEAMQIAAYAHDIERAFREGSNDDFFKDKEFNDPEKLKEHEEKGAMIISEFLEKNNYEHSNTARVYNMVRHHEEGGDLESDLIQGADSLSFLENNVSKFIARIPIMGKEKIEKKITWMYERISLNKAKELAKPFYDEAVKKLANN